MADKSIGSLPAANAVTAADLFALEQTGTAKKLTGAKLEEWLLALADGHGGISDISYTAPVPPSLNGTMTITLADGAVTTVTVTNGRGISNISWTESGTSGDGRIHTGTISYNDGTTSTMEIRDGVKGDKGDKGDTGDTGVSITNIAKTAESGSVATYTIYFSDGTSTTFDVRNGTSISNIGYTPAPSGSLDATIRVELTDGSSYPFTVTNGKGIASLALVGGTHAAGTTDTYRITFNDGDVFEFPVYNGTNGTGAVSSVAGIGVVGAGGDVPLILRGNGAPTPSTIGQTNQLYFDTGNSVMYICLGESGGTYDWAGAGITVDSALSTTSTNPVQNAVLTNKIGTGTLLTHSTDLVGAVNEVKLSIPVQALTVPLSDSSGGSAGTQLAWAHGDHSHPLNVDNTAPSALAATASAGTGLTYARIDHKHPFPTADNVAALALDGHAVEINFVQDLDNLVSGVGAFQPSTLNSPYSDTWGFVISAGDASYTRMQVAYPFNAAYPPKRRDLSGGTWSAWTYVMGSTTLPSALPVNMGGTGASTASAARSNLGVQQFSVQTVSVDDREINASTYTSFNIATARTGYTPVGIVGFAIENATNGGSGNTQCMSNRIYLNSSGNVVWWIRNISENAVKIKATAHILYSKND